MPVVLSLGRIFEDTDIHISGPMVKNHVSSKNGLRIQCSTENFVPIVVLGLSTTSSSSSSSATPTSLPQESTGSVPIPASFDSERADEQERRSPVPDPTKNPKPNKIEDHEPERVTPSSSEIPEWLREFSGWKRSRTLWSQRPWAQWVTRELFPWTLFGLTKTSGNGLSQYSCSFPERPKLRDLSEDQRYKGSLQSYLAQKIWVILITTDHKILSEEMWISKQSQISSCGTRLSYSMDSILSVQNKKLHRTLKGARKSSWSRPRNQKSFTLTIPWNLAKPAKTYRGIIAHQSLTVQEQIGLLREQYAEKTDICDRVAIGIGRKWVGGFHGMLTATCEIVRTDCLVRKHYTKSDLVHA